MCVAAGPPIGAQTAYTGRNRTQTANSCQLPIALWLRVEMHEFLPHSDLDFRWLELVQALRLLTQRM